MRGRWTAVKTLVLAASILVRYDTMEILVYVEPGGEVQTAAEFVAHACDVAHSLDLALPTPYLLGQRMWDEKASAAAYPTRQVFMEALVPILRGELEATRVPAVINGAGSVFATTAARHWLRLLDAIDRPASTPRARTAALTPFVGWSAERVALASENEWEDLHRRLHRWNRILRSSGVHTDGGATP